MYWCTFTVSSVLEQIIGVQVLSVRTSSVLIHMIGAHLLSEQVVNWYRFQNEMTGAHLLSVRTSSVLVCMIGVHLLSVRTSSIGTHYWCTLTVQSKQVVYCHWYR